MIDLSDLTLDQLLALNEELKKYEDTNKLEFITPYSFQCRFMNASLESRARLFRGGNRCGKTYTGAAEMAMHLTGKYQDWYEGKRFTESGHNFWCIGVDLDQCARIMQKELFGTSNIRVTENLGTGTIPLDNIILEPMEKDGGRIKSCSIKHADGGTNTLYFFGAAQGFHTLMGASVKFIWIDEEPPHKSLDIFNMCVMRTATSDGQVIITATPENGFTTLIKMFDEDETGKLFTQTAGWDDCPHLSEEWKADALATTPDYLKPTKRFGIPAAGNGAVFPFEDSKITFDPNDKSVFDISDPANVINAGIDWGDVKDPTTIVHTVLNKNTGVIYCISEKEYKKDWYDRSPEHLADEILKGPYPNVRLICPHDSGLGQTHELAKANVLRGKGLYKLSDNKLPGYLMNKNGNKAPNAIAPGLYEMQKMFHDGKLKVSTECTSLLREMRSYSAIKKDTGKEIFKGGAGDHLIDSFRLSVIGHLRHLNDLIYTACIPGAEDPLNVPVQEWGNRPADPQYEQTNFLVQNNGWEENIIY